MKNIGDAIDKKTSHPKTNYTLGDDNDSDIKNILIN